MRVLSSSSALHRHPASRSLEERKFSQSLDSGASSYQWTLKSDDPAQTTSRELTSSDSEECYRASAAAHIDQNSPYLDAEEKAASQVDRTLKIDSKSAGRCLHMRVRRGGFYIDREAELAEVDTAWQRHFSGKQILSATPVLQFEKLQNPAASLVDWLPEDFEWSATDSQVTALSVQTEATRQSS